MNELHRALARRKRIGAPGTTTPVLLAAGDGWSVHDVVCTCGPQDRPFEERHSDVSIAIVVGGTFQYRSTSGRALMTPGSLLLGNAGHAFECDHECGVGDRCLAFHYRPDYFERIAGAPGARATGAFRSPRLPPIAALSSIVASGCAALAGSPAPAWDEVALNLAARAVQIATGHAGTMPSISPRGLSRITEVTRWIEESPDEPHGIAALAARARLSPYHFLRTFERLTGVTPHQFVLRTRLRRAAADVVRLGDRIIDVAFRSGFSDVSNFNRAFRAEFGMSPRGYRARASGRVNVLS